MTSILHAVLFPKSLFSIKQAKVWLKQHNLTPIHNRDTKNIHCFRIVEKQKGKQFFTKILSNKVISNPHFFMLKNASSKLIGLSVILFKKDKSPYVDITYPFSVKMFTY